MSTATQNALFHFKRCAEEAPAGTYEDVKQLNEVLGKACTNLMADLRAMGLKANACDPIFEVEAAIYAYVQRSNPDSTIFPRAEGFGKSMDGPERERVLAQAESNRDTLRRLGVLED